MPVPDHEQHRHALDAEATLAEVALLDDLADLYATEQDAALRRTFADQYRSAIGIHPERRHDFRAALERIKDGGGMPVADLIALLRRHMSASPSDASAAVVV